MRQLAVVLLALMALLPGALSAMQGVTKVSHVMRRNIQRAEFEVLEEKKTWDINQKPEIQAVDLRTSGLLRAVENQGQCGSCVAFSTAHTWTDYFNSRNKMCNFARFATQHILNCAISCSGGWPATVNDWIKNKGITTQSCLAYRTAKNPCSNFCDNGNSISQKLRSGYTCTTSPSVMVSWLNAGYPLQVWLGLMYKFYDHGSVTVARDSVYPRSTGNANFLGNHAMEIVGYGALNGVNYWLVKNSWGPKWGDGGFVKIRRGVNQGGIESHGACRPLYAGCPSLNGSPFDMQSKTDHHVLDDEGEPGDANDTGIWNNIGESMPGGQTPAEKAADLIDEAASFAVHVLLAATKNEGGFECVPALEDRTDQNITGAAMEQASVQAELDLALNSVTVHSADQQLIAGVGFHFVFSFSTTIHNCTDAGGTWDATVHVTADGFLIMQNIFKTTPPPAGDGINTGAVVGGSLAAIFVVAAAGGFLGYRHYKARKTIKKLTDIHKQVLDRVSILEAGPNGSAVREAALSEMLNSGTAGRPKPPPPKAARGAPVNFHTNSV